MNVRVKFLQERDFMVQLENCSGEHLLIDTDAVMQLDQETLEILRITNELDCINLNSDATYFVFGEKAQMALETLQNFNCSEIYCLTGDFNAIGNEVFAIQLMKHHHENNMASK